MLKLEYIQAVVGPTLHVLNAVAGIKCEVEHVQSASSIPAYRAMCIGVGFEGGAEGGAYLSVEPQVGKTIAARMIGSDRGVLSEADVVEALMELVNMFVGNAISVLIKNGLRVDITPPERFHEPPPLPYGANCALVHLKSEAGPIKLGVIIAEPAR